MLATAGSHVANQAAVPGVQGGKGPIRILHVVGGMNRGGVETWLMHVLRHIDRGRFRMDFLVHTEGPCAYDDEIRALGSNVIPCLEPRRPWRFARNFRRVMREHGPYDVVHSHVHHYSGFVLRLACKAGVPVRIAHSHNDTSRVDRASGLLRRAYLALTERWVRRHATAGLAASGKAAAALFGPEWRADPRWQVLYCGIDLSPFREGVDRREVRAELGIAENAFVIGHVGSFTEQKNHAFLVEVAAEVARRRPDARLLLVGDGPLRPDIERKVAELGLTGKVVFAGLRADVPRLMLGAMDAFLLPSLYEGVPLVGMEAQAAGLPLLVSDAVTGELDVVGPLLRRLSLSQPASAWAEAALAVRDSPPAISRSEALAAVEKSPFDVRRSVSALAEVYDV